MKYMYERLRLAVSEYLNCFNCFVNSNFVVKRMACSLQDSDITEDLFAGTVHILEECVSPRHTTASPKAIKTPTTIQIAPLDTAVDGSNGLKCLDG